jgi:hypothetical protein
VLRCEIRGPIEPPTDRGRLLGVVFWQEKEVTALCMHLANHENASGAPQSKEDRVKWWENVMQDDRSPCSRLACKSVSNPVTFPVWWCPPFRQPTSHSAAHRWRLLVEPRARSSSSCCQRSCSELRRQTSRCLFDSARLRNGVCTYRRLVRPSTKQPVCNSPLPNWPSLATDM